MSKANYLSVAIIGNGTSSGTGVFDVNTGNIIQNVMFCNIHISATDPTFADITVLEIPNDHYLKLHDVPVLCIHITQNVDVDKFKNNPQKVLDLIKLNSLHSNYIICSSCGGTGQYHGLNSVELCKDCIGRGTIP
jgi:hypothetical protein